MLSKRAKGFALVVIVPFLAGSCAVPSLIDRPDGRPGILIQGVTKKQILIALINEMVTAGTQLRALTDSSAVFAKRPDSASKTGPSRSGRGVGSEVRITFELVESNSGIRVLASGATVTNPGGRLEKVADATGGNIGQEMKAMLQRLKTHLESE